MSTTESDDDLECLVCELVQDIEHEDDEPILHAVAGVHDVDVPYASPSTYICSECLAQFIEWKVERSVMVWVADYLQPEIRDEIDEAVSEILEDYDAAIYDGEFRNAMTARDDAEPITDIN